MKDACDAGKDMIVKCPAKKDSNFVVNRVHLFGILTIGSGYYQRTFAVNIANNILFKVIPDCKLQKVNIPRLNKQFLLALDIY